MGLLVNGEWKDHWYDTKRTGGKFVRENARFRRWVTRDGSPGPNGEEAVPAEANRYHLYVSLACPWAHRTLIFRRLKGLEGLIDVSVVHPDMLSQGWTFEGEFPGTIADQVNGAAFMHQVYTRAKADYTGRVTVPVLWDKREGTIVSNESSEIIRMFNQAFDGLTGNTLDFYPKHLREAIDEVNEFVYHNINNGVYKTGFATTQEAYTEAFQVLFSALDRIEARLAQNRYLVGDHLTEADWRLFTTLIRFDPVYVGHFKCNQQRIADYPNLSHYLRDLYQVEGVAETVNLAHIKRHYYYSHATINPTRVVPVGPDLNNDAPHDRERLGPRVIHQR